MNEAGRGMLLLAVGITTARITWSGSFGNFVQQRMQWPLAIAAVCVIVLGVVDLVRYVRASGQDDRQVAPAVGVLMVLPLVVLVGVAPAALGASAADRVDSYEPPEPDTEVWALPDDDPLELSMLDFVNQVYYDERQLLAGRSVVLEGLVANDESIDDGFLLVRFLVSCCAADGIPVKIALRDAPAPLDDDTWIRAQVVWEPPPDDPVGFDPADGPEYIEVQVESIDVLPGPPDDPYESPF